MKVLFITSSYKSDGAITNCLRNIFKQMYNSIDIEVAHMDVNDAYVEQMPIKLHYINGYEGNISYREKIAQILKNEKGINKIINLCNYILSKVVTKKEVRPAIKLFVTQYMSYKKIKQIVSDGNYDCIVSVCAEFSNHYIGYKLKKKYKNLKWYTYYFDPFSFNAVEKKWKKQKTELEYKLLNKADGIIVTRQMKKEFAESKFNCYLDKTVVCEFPNVTDNRRSDNNTTIEFEKSKINCLFTGFIYNGVRDPKYFLELMQKADKNIKFYIVGGFYDAEERKSYSEYEEKMKDRFVIVDAVPLEESFRIMNEADILVNLGNSMQNQLPSKIFDYISMGKPIVNVCKLRNCLTVPYMEEYPCSLNLFEDEEITPEKVNVFDDFCKKSKDVLVSYDEISEKFQTSTPEYVAEQIMKILN